MDLAGFCRELEDIMDLPSGTLKGSTRLSGIDSWDSLAVVGFIGMADEKYDAKVPPKRINECQTVDELAALISEFSN